MAMLRMHHETAVRRKPPTRNFTGEKKKKLERSLTKQRLFMFLRKYKGGLP
jgi:hypothetical protein